ncbi:MAG: ATP-binding cassette domain-containing protein [Finegoldia magna]|uniref:ABC transporter, ATP-binding protein n=1 Tax=Finegoldia magna ATCC 53516 TaxID=525282 RepID=D6S9E9_FINMA|nr:oligopeptide/dipeptide ABC transporter ATP-binding protein [Finegoldia magna]EFH93427.1 ABC transporter, ATP-binding protein [Finegoldia magna ATCC 53516]MBS5942793.1 ATP-binding cassette domain-containing protein [Finegoldia magna]MDU5223945.1 ATP-binding cassette domain-containing protein [Finegoldia magna]MDU5236236.1 ATP-binding cassette domain-containing protein [Finegoldia magna]
MENKALLEVKNLKKYFQTKRGMLHAVDDINISIKKGETLGLVGESGCGKSTAGRAILRLHEPTSGEILLNGENVLKYKTRSEINKMRQEMQIVFQDPYSSLNPRMNTFELISDPLIVNKITKNQDELENRVYEMMEIVGLEERLAGSYPHELDGGRRQRIGIARALILRPQFIVLDEPVSALDVSIQAQILNLMDELQDRLSLTYLFISHDLSVVKHISDRIAVMYLGKIVELTDYKRIFSDPLHPYTKALLSAIPIPKYGLKRERIILKGDVPSPIDPPEGCRFCGRCPYKMDICEKKTPELTEIDDNHFVACHLYNK